LFAGEIRKGASFPAAHKMAKTSHGAKRSMNCVIRSHSDTGSHDGVIIGRQSSRRLNWTPVESSAGVTA
jgi:hypothetical protein